jgi:RNA polymerase sigma factor (TIGR02999 family)
VDHARGRHAQKRGGEWEKLSLETALPFFSERPEQFLALDEALEQLARLSPRQAQVIQLRFFAGLTADQTAAMLSISPETVKLDSRFAKAWLQRQMRPKETSRPGTKSHDNL